MKTPSITLCFSELPSSCCTQGCQRTYFRHIKINLCHKKKYRNVEICQKEEKHDHRYGKELTHTVVQLKSLIMTLYKKSLTQPLPPLSLPSP